MFYYIPAVKTSQYKMPAAIEKCVRKQSIRYMHNKNHFSLEYFQFMRRLLMANVHYVQLPAGQDKLVSIKCDLIYSGLVNRDSLFLLMIV